MIKLIIHTEFKLISIVLFLINGKKKNQVFKETPTLVSC